LLEKSLYAKGKVKVRQDALDNPGDDDHIKHNVTKESHPTAMTEQVYIGEGIVRLAVRSNITLSEVTAIKMELLAAARRTKELQLDLSEAGEIDVAGLKSILLAKRESQRLGNNLHVVAHHHAAIDVLECYMSSFFGDSLTSPPYYGDYPSE
jgi:anti-anti-sigma regulatory factor